MARTRMLLICHIILAVLWPSALVQALPRLQTRQNPVETSTSYWVANIKRQGTVAYGTNANYQIYRNVKDFGAKGDGVSDDTIAINNAISAGNRCMQGCDSSTTTPAIIYFPPGVYMVSAPIVQLYYTQFIGDALSLPTIKATSAFQGIAIIDADPYIPGGNGANFYTNQNNFYRQIRNFIIDLTGMPISSGAGIHWQVAQATSLQNIRFEMLPGGGANNKQQGIFMDNGSGGFMSDLIFNGGLYGAFFGNQQFTTRNLTFNGCQTGIYMNWDWVWTLKSVTIENCGVGIDMTSGGSTGGNQSVGSVLLLDSTISNTPIGIKTAFNANSIPKTGGTLIVDNVNFIGARIAIADSSGSQILAGGSVVESWAQGDTYTPAQGAQKVKRVPQVQSVSDCDVSSQVPMVSASASFYQLAGVSTTSSVYSATASTSATSPVLIASAVNSTAIVPPAISMTSSSPPFPSTYINSSAIPPAMSISGYATQASSQACTVSQAPLTSSRVQQQLTAPTLPAALLSGSNIYERSKPQYENEPVSAFISVKSAGAKGDGVTDDTQAIQNLLNSVTSDQIVYFDHGAYVITKTVKVPKNIRITGEIWPLIMASGPAFSDQTNPQPVFQIGMPGDEGAVEMSDLIFETLGPAPGAILVEWNVAQDTQGACGMWDVHFRIGGSAGTQLQQDKCQGNITNSQHFNPECAGSFLMMHITQQATAYIENVWLWVADHDLDITTHNETNIYNGRGMLVESQGPVWLYGTSVEHSQLYNYQIANAQHIFMGTIQTETPYMQSSPDALNGGFTPNAAYSDPTFTDCTDEYCKKSWGLRIVDSTDVYMYGGGLYSFFDNYLQTCLETESCQENMVDIECSDNIYLYGLTTKASVNIVTLNGAGAALGKDNTNSFGQTLALFQQ